MTTTRISDIIVPSIFAAYMDVYTKEKSRVVTSGLVTRSAFLDEKLRGGGNTFDVPAFKDLDNTAANISSDDPSSLATPLSIGTCKEIAVRLSRNQAWGSMNLAGELAGADPLAAIERRVAKYWDREIQRTVIATMQGVFADNDAAPSGTEHVEDDLSNSIIGGAFVNGITNFSASAAIETAGLLGDEADVLGALLVHSVVYQTMQKNNLIDFVPDSDQKVNIPTFHGYRVIVDDGMPNPAGSVAAATSAGIYHSWFFAPGAIQFGVGTATDPVALEKNERSGNGAGEQTLHTRQVYCIHPTGHKFATSASGGGPTNGTGSGNLAHAGSWARVYPERKQIGIARLITRES